MWHVFFMIVLASAHHAIEPNEQMHCKINPLTCILPAPKSVILQGGVFILPTTSAISAKGCAHRVVDQFIADVNKFTKCNFINAKGGNIIFLCDGVQNDDESYRITIDPSRITISATTERGLFWGSRSFLQLIIHAARNCENVISIPCAQIYDEPAFRWRGLNLDCARHFMSKEYIFKTIDVLSLYRMNVLHLHLTDDQGWRVEIKKYPLLTEIGAWRKQNGKKYGGFYTQKEIKEIVEYANRRHVLVVPEIDMPGHVQAAIASYPHLSCMGEKIEVSTRWGIHKDVLCVGKESTFDFVKDVLDEAIALFPSKYFHIGGDECLTLRWKRCEYCQMRIKNENLPNEKALHGYFVTRVASYLKLKGKILIGWDEIAESNLPENAVVQSWRGFKGAEIAAASGCKAIVSPTSHCYFDYGLTYTGLKKVYSFSPIPPMLPFGDEHLIMGSEACMWTEFAPEGKVDYMLYPRLLVLSEALWSSSQRKNFNEFLPRLRAQYPLLTALKVSYGPESEHYLWRLRYVARTIKIFFTILFHDPEAAWENLTHYHETN
ncbi:MAG: beta-N-acetylhexosaminidase [Spirochaetes bacterium]|nr:beta-N-acetylhexosaminidase [Spirochaetota bacterium]